MVLRSAVCLNTLAVSRCGAVDRLRHCRRADEGNRLDMRVGDEPFAYFLAPLHHADDTRRQAGISEQLHESGAGERCLLGRLEEERVPAGDGDRHHPQRNQGREIERRNADHHTHRFADGMAVDIPRNVGQSLSHQLGGNAAGKFDDVKPAPQRAARLAQQLAVFADDAVCHVREVLFQQLPELEQDVGPIRRRSGAPAREGTGGGGACLVHLLRRGLAHRRQHLGRVRRIVDVAARVPTALDPGSADQVQRGSRTRGCCRRPIRGSNGAHEVLRKLESLFTDVPVEAAQSAVERTGERSVQRSTTLMSS